MSKEMTPSKEKQSTKSWKDYFNNRSVKNINAYLDKLVGVGFAVAAVTIASNPVLMLLAVFAAPGLYAAGVMQHASIRRQAVEDFNNSLDYNETHLRVSNAKWANILRALSPIPDLGRTTPRFRSAAPNTP